MRKLPGFLKDYFWDTDFKSIAPDKNRIYILRRILEYGNLKAVNWMFNNFKIAEIKNALSNFRGYSQKSANFWAVMLDVKKEDVKCLSRSFRETQKKFWPY
ncbi:MAG: hypothetical protein V1927_05775 [Candidatus Omnitrophota bacterium]